MDVEENLVCCVKIKTACKCGRKSEVMECGSGGIPIPGKRTYFGLLKNPNIMKRTGEDKYAILECDDDCLKSQRLEALRQGLEISDDRLEIEYDPWLVEQAKKDIQFIKNIEHDFSQMLAHVHHNNTLWKDEDKEPVFKKFQPMKTYRRRLIHELAALYGFQGVSIDIEPNRYCHISAPKNSSGCKLPKTLLSEVAEK